MMVAPALALGVKLRVLAAVGDDSAAQVIPDVTIGDHRDLATMREFAEHCDVLTFVDEVVSSGMLRTYEAEGLLLRSSADSLIRARDKAYLRDALVPLLEDDASFDFEIAVLVARSPHSQAAVWAVTEIVREIGSGMTTITPAPDLGGKLSGQAQRIALEVAGLINLVGVMNVEMCVVDGRVVVKQIAMGPHDSGIWTIDGSLTSQFEQHLRAILDLPLGSTDLLAPSVVSASVVGTDKTDLYRPYLHVFARDPGVKVHQNGQVVGTGRKSVHVTVVGSNVSDLRLRAAHAADYISGVIDE